MLSLNSEDVRYSVTRAHLLSVTEAVQHEVQMWAFTNGASKINVFNIANPKDVIDLANGVSSWYKS